MIIKTKSIRDPKKDTDGIRLLVVRYPRRVKRTHYDIWYPALAPSEYFGNGKIEKLRGKILNRNTEKKCPVAPMPEPI